MLHPSYSDLIDVVNKDIEPGDDLIVQSRYSIVIATAKRARQIIEAENTGRDYEETYYKVNKKPLSVAIDEVYTSKVKIVSEEKALEAAEKASMLSEQRSSEDELLAENRNFSMEDTIEE